MEQFQFIEQAPTYDECMNKIRNKFGQSAKIHIMFNKTIQRRFLGFFPREWVELTGYVLPNYSNYAKYITPQRPQDPEEEKKKLEEEKKKILAAAGKPDPAQALLHKMVNDVRTIKEKIEAGTAGDEHPALRRIGEILDMNDFTPAYSKTILDRARKELSLDDLEDYDALQDRVVEWIGESVKIYTAAKPARPPRIFVLVGPTGVGKTTTIGKLAATFGVGYTEKRPPLSVRMISTDNWRIGAAQQMERYGEYMDIPVSAVDNLEDFRKVLALYTEGVDMIFVDTSGKSPQDAAELAKMKPFLDACGSQVEVHLALEAKTKSSDIRDILRQFEPFGYRSVIVTKVDETRRLGNVISALADPPSGSGEPGKPISYITNGQGVPHDLEPASAVRFLINLEGFRINREAIEKKFPKDIEIIQWRYTNGRSG
jgi:flagellar biosynthesis protein FlhF